MNYDCVISTFNHVESGCYLTGSVHVYDGVFCRIGSSVIQSRTIGKWSKMGVGAVVIDDIPQVTAIGVTAKIRSHSAK